MSNPTTPFSWQMPTATDLVTDLPADFEVFGQAVATSMADLLGGTTGQVLKKNTNADMDFVWAADSAGMTNPMTTTGDMIYSSSGSTPARLGIGSSGQVVTVAGGVPTWATPSSGAVVQVKSATYSTATSNTSGTYADTGLSLSITPTSASNKVLVMVSQAFYMNRLNEELGVNFRLMQGAGAIFTDAFANWQYVNTFTASTDWGWQTRYDVTYLASPATTSSTTYKTQFAVAVTASSPLVTAQESSRISTITLMEVTP